MVGYSPNEKDLSYAAHTAAGALSGIVTRACLQPIDVLKIRFQVLCYWLYWLYFYLVIPTVQTYMYIAYGKCSKHSYLIRSISDKFT